MHTNPHNKDPRTHLFQSGLYVYADDSGGKGAKIVEAETPQEKLKEEQINMEGVRKELESRKGDLPDDVYKKAMDILSSGSNSEKQLVKRMLSGLITPQRFRLLRKFLFYSEGDEETKKFTKELAEREIAGNIDTKGFELAISALNRGNPEDYELVKDLLREKITVSTFKRKLKGKNKLKEKTIEAQEAEKEARTDEMSPEDTQIKTGDANLIKRITGAVTNLGRMSPNMVGETVEFRNYSKILIESYRQFTEHYDSLGPVFDQMVGDNATWKEELYDGLFGIFPTVIVQGEAPVTRDQVEKVLRSFETGKNRKLKVPEHIDVIFDTMKKLQEMRLKIQEYEVKIAQILREIENRVGKQALEESVIENAGNWIGFPLKEGQKIRYKTKTRTGEGEEEAEIINVKLSTPAKDSEGNILPGTGTVMITVGGVGEFTENQFRKWVDATDACPVVKNVRELEEITGIIDFGVKPEAGTELAYDKLTGRDENDDVTREERIVAITNITDEYVELDTEVTVLRMEEAPRMVYRGELTEDRRKKKLTLGEFAKWIRRRDAVPNPKDQATMRKMGEALQAARKTRYAASMDPSYNPVISLERGSVLYTNTPFKGPGSGKITVGDIANDRVVLNGDPHTFAQAMRTARKRELESYQPFEGDEESNPAGVAQAQTQEKQAVIQQMQKDFAAQEDEEGSSFVEGADAPTAHKNIQHWGQDIPGVRIPPGSAVDGLEGGARRPSQSYMRDLWKTTSFLSLQDLWELGKAAYEYHVRRWTRKVKESFAKIGRHLPYVGVEMDRIRQASETEEVNQFKEAMDNWGVWQIEETMWYTKNRDQLKACMITLAAKGQLRWEEIRLWRAVNRFVHSSKYIPIPSSGDFTERDKNGMTGLDYIQPAIDSLWGEGQWSEWFNQNNNTFEQNKKAFHHKGDQLEGDPKNIGGVTYELGKLLRKHKEGEYVDPQEYEGLIDFIIHKGKSSAEAKIYYIIEGVAAKNTRGQTILPWDRVGNLDGEYLNRLPMLDYLTDKASQKPYQESKRPWKRADFEKLIAYWDGGVGRIPDTTRKTGNPPKKAIDFLWGEVLRLPWVQARTNKGLRNAEQIDHDDSHVIVPLASEKLVQQICSGPSGNKKYFTEEGITNAYPGYNRFIKTCAKLDDFPKVMATIKSFVIFDSILSDRYLKRDEDRYMRLSKANYYRRSVVDTMYTIDHQKQLHKMIRNIGKAFDWDVSLMFEDTKNIRTDKAQAEKQNQVEDFIKRFGSELEAKTKTDEGKKKLIQAVKDTQLTGMYYDLADTTEAQDAAVNKRRAMFDKEAANYGVFAGQL
ncbi:hypothetical protein KKG51_00420 [Patescibacteria group bacterium]|nr:hypothetical protein [Patescibacteria group bacterium]